jgi:hypothetical protein
MCPPALLLLLHVVRTGATSIATIGSCRTEAAAVNSSKLATIALNPRYQPALDGACMRDASAVDVTPYEAVPGCANVSGAATTPPRANATLFSNVTSCQELYAAWVALCDGFAACSAAAAPPCCGERLLVRGMEAYPNTLDGSDAYQYRGIFLRDAVSRNGLADTWTQENGNGVSPRPEPSTGRGGEGVVWWFAWRWTLSREGASRSCTPCA